MLFRCLVNVACDVGNTNTHRIVIQTGKQQECGKKLTKAENKNFVFRSNQYKHDYCIMDILYQLSHANAYIVKLLFFSTVHHLFYHIRELKWLKSRMKMCMIFFFQHFHNQMYQNLSSCATVFYQIDGKITVFVQEISCFILIKKDKYRIFMHAFKN